jgi:hypothetical protein
MVKVEQMKQVKQVAQNKVGRRQPNAGSAAKVSGSDINANENRLSLSQALPCMLPDS